MRTTLCLAAWLLTQSALAADMPMKAEAEAAKEDASQAVAAAPRARPFHHRPVFLNMLRRSNEIRRRVGLFPHRLHPALTAAAQDHANYMARTGQFSHYINGGPQYRANKYGFRAGVLENIAAGSATVEGTFNQWVGSPPHYASIVSGTTEAGFGYAVGANGYAYWVSVYASPAQGDSIGDTDSVVAAALAEEVDEETQRQETEKNVAQNQPGESNVAPAGAEVPVEAAPAVASANATGENPAGNTNVTNARPNNIYYYYPQNNNNGRSRRWFRRS